MNRKWIVIALALALVLFACKNIEDGGEIQQPPAPEQGSGENLGGNGGESGGGEQKPGEGENSGGEENGNESGDDDEPGDKIANVEDVIKLVIGEDEYKKLYNSGKFVPTSITLTAQTIKDIGANFSGLSTYENKEKDIKNISDIHKKIISDYKEAIVAQDKGLINITTSKLNSYSIPVNFSGTFNLSEITLPTTNDGKGDFTNATLTNNGEGISIDKLNTIRGTSLPTLIFNKSETNVTRKDILLVEEVGKNVYNLYKDYSDKNALTKLKITGNLEKYAVNGEKISGNSGTYTLLSNKNMVKPATDTSVKFLTIDALIQMYKQLKTAYFINMIISGDAKEATNVDWKLTNIVFEGDMSNITNTGSKDLTGIVYFKNKAYNNTGKQHVYGLLKLDSLEGVSNGTFNVYLDASSAVLDVRGVDKNSINDYNRGGILAGGGYAHVIYFSDDFSSIKDDQTAIYALCDKFSNNQDARFIHAYLGDNKVQGQSFNKKPNDEASDTPRSLKEFEWFGNNYEDKSVYKFENGDNFALNNKRIEFIDPETQKIIFSLVNDRQYNS